MSKLSNMLKMLFILNKRDLVKISELSNRLEVSPKQIRRYRDELDMSGIFVESLTGKYGGYRLIDKNQHIPLVTNISEQEEKMIDLISRKDYLDIKEMYSSIASFLSNDDMRAISLNNLEPNLFYGLIQMHESIKENKVLELEYMYNDNPLEFTFSPYFTFQKYGVWYVLGKSGYNNKIIQLRIERIINLKQSTQTYELSSNEVNMYKNRIKKTVGIYLNEKQYKIKIESSALSKNDLEGLLECSIQEENNLYSFNSYSLPEVKRKLMSLGSLVLVKEPMELINMIINEIKDMKDNYSIKE